jgi:PAS domain S-box-containing protein
MHSWHSHRTTRNETIEPGEEMSEQNASSQGSEDMRLPIPGNGALQAGDELFRLLFEKSNDALFISIPEGGVISANPEACRLFGMTEEEFRQGGRAVIVDPSDDRFRAALEIRARTGEFNGELNFVRKNGEVFPADISSSIFTDFSGNSRATVRIRDISGRKLAEQALSETNERFIKLLDTIPTVAVQGYELDGTVIYWNKASETLYGFRSEEALGANLLDLLIPPEMRDEVMKAILQMGATGTPLPAGELSLLRRDGSRVPIHSSHVLIQTGESQPVLFCMNIDLSERKLMEKMLQQASDEWRRTFDTIPDMITILDSQHRIVRANQAAWQKLGCGMRDLLGKPCYTLFHGLDSPPEACLHAQLLRDGLAHSAEIFEHTLNSYLDVTVTPLHDLDGKLTGSIHVAHDITAMKLTGESLRESELLYRSILTASPDNITITDLTGAIRMVSPKGLAMFGYEREEQLLGHPVVEFVAPEDRERAAANILRMVKGTYTGPDEYRALRGDGSPVMVEANGDFIIGTDGRPESMIFVIRDISERKRVESDLNRKNIEIEQFIYTVSHDLRSPLVTIKTFLGYLGEDLSSGDSERFDRDMEFMHSAASRMEALLDELLDMARVGRAHNPRESVTYYELLAEALEAVAGQISTGNVDVQVSGANSILCGDRRRLLQIWQNLLDNALKYMGAQETPCVEVGVEEQGGDTLFFVRDNGIGIVPEYQEKVFGIFEKLDRTIGGVGMGLTMVRRIVEMYGGHIRVESAGSGSGSCFRFTLPEALKECGLRGEKRAAASCQTVSF